jgi:carbon-monoxide dehydrogenase medium subunit
MKLPDFEYAAPPSASDAVALLAARPGEAKIIAGGQSLLPAMAFRLAQPALLVDLRNIEGLARIAVEPSGVRLGARTRWRDIEDDNRLSHAHPLLAEAVRHIAHYQVRNRGTVGGSLAHADPAAELPCIAVTCDGELRVLGPHGERPVQAADFFLGPLATALADDEMIVELQLPGWPAARRWAFGEFSMRPGDFALAGVAVFYDCDPQQRAIEAHIGVFGACDRPQRLHRAEQALTGNTIDAGVAQSVARIAAGEVIPPSDIHGSADYRRALVESLLERALLESASRS